MDKANMQQFMYLASKRGLTDGRYVFIAVHPFATAEMMLREKVYISNFLWVLPWHGKQDSINNFLFAPEEEIKKAFQSFFVLVPQVSTHSPTFSTFL